MSVSSSETNLYDFYRLIGEGSFASITEGKNYCAVSGNETSWPQIIFDVHFKESAGSALNIVFSDAAEKFDIRLAVCNREQFDPADQELLRRSEIYPVGNWKLMEINSSNELKKGMKGEFDIRKFTKPAEIPEFVSLVNNNLMNSQKVNVGLFQELIHQQGIEMYGLFNGDEVVSGLLSYAGANKVAGLYFITTRQDYRGKGLAAGLIGCVTESLFNNGIEKVVLQAMPKAVNLYARMGFSHQGELIIFWKK